MNHNSNRNNQHFVPQGAERKKGYTSCPLNSWLLGTQTTLRNDPDPTVQNMRNELTEIVEEYDTSAIQAVSLRSITHENKDDIVDDMLKVKYLLNV